jgi:hypothetical protein
MKSAVYTYAALSAMKDFFDFPPEKNHNRGNKKTILTKKQKKIREKAKLARKARKKQRMLKK